ncbi:MAG: L-threonylcarbamoyladenylate synthase [Bdellovibrionales bacterium]
MGLITIDEAIKLLKAGTPVALPTETVYGLACPINQPAALKKVFEIKKRPLNDPLIVHVSDTEMARTLFKEPSVDFDKLASAFWPGPLTLISKKNKELVSDLITSNLESVAIRIPASELFREIIKKTGAPLAAPSANMFKKVSPTTAEHVLETLPLSLIHISEPTRRS